MLFDDMNWMAVIVGATLAFGLGMIWFSPVMFGRAWAAGNHGINPPASLPVTAMLIQGLGTFALALVVGLPDTGGLISTAVLAILAASLLVAGMAFSAKIPGRDADRRGLHGLKMSRCGAAWPLFVCVAAATSANKQSLRTALTARLPSR